MAGKFAIDVRRFCDKTKTKVDTVVRLVAFELSAKFVEKSPVGDPSHWKHKAPKGYVGGRFRANWQFGSGGINKSITNEHDPDGGATTSRLAGEMAGVRAGGIIYITNSLPYALPIEHGWSKQAPMGIVETTVRDYASTVNKVVRGLK